jgi:hypothetical protein
MTPKERFIDATYRAHAGKYSYDNVEFTGVMHKITVTCRICGDFDTTPHRHLNFLEECPTCGGQLTIEEVVDNLETLDEQEEEEDGD